MKYTNELKKDLLENGVFNEFCSARKQLYKGHREAYQEFLDCYGEIGVKACESLKASKTRKRKVITRRFTRIVELEKAIFLTITFKPSVLASTSEETRAKYVKRLLKSECAKYVANIDFGAKNGREHYHALVMPLNGSIDLKKWHKYGCIKADRVRNTKKDCEKVARYVAKLSNHALKNTGKMPRVIFSRGWLEMKKYYDDNLERLPF